ncbi:hypothetical protein [Mesoterricola sediminis]|uniref:Uncharacterized protein n=1 Tax=Mesoterricola sediminis TaxID=2927980 RepID=A0AA48GVH0_9BACT|nr:hypothetical protein [Mesoterricola sediminis]BDU76390.1 hypothetical protein METESE_13480 [Mesoterricola sediminis]
MPRSSRQRPPSPWAPRLFLGLLLAPTACAEVIRFEPPFAFTRTDGSRVALERIDTRLWSAEDLERLSTQLGTATVRPFPYREAQTGLSLALAAGDCLPADTPGPAETKGAPEGWPFTVEGEVHPDRSRRGAARPMAAALGPRGELRVMWGRTQPWLEVYADRTPLAVRSLPEADPDAPWTTEAVLGDTGVAWPDPDRTLAVLDTEKGGLTTVTLPGGGTEALGPLAWGEGGLLYAADAGEAWIWRIPTDRSPATPERLCRFRDLLPDPDQEGAVQVLAMAAQGADLWVLVRHHGYDRIVRVGKARTVPQRPFRAITGLPEARIALAPLPTGTALLLGSTLLHVDPGGCASPIPLEAAFPEGLGVPLGLQAGPSGSLLVYLDETWPSGDRTGSRRHAVRVLKAKPPRRAAGDPPRFPLKVAAWYEDGQGDLARRLAFWPILGEGGQAAESLAVRPDGTLLVVDQVNGQVLVVGGGALAAKDRVLRLGGRHADRFSGAFFAPNAIAVDAEGALYVSDGGLERICRISADLKTLEVIAEGRAFTGVAVDPAGHVYAASEGRIARLTAGTWEEHVLVEGLAEGAFLDGAGEETPAFVPVSLLWNRDGSLWFCNDASSGPGEGVFRLLGARTGGGSAKLRLEQVSSHFLNQLAQAPDGRVLGVGEGGLFALEPGEEHPERPLDTLHGVDLGDLKRVTLSGLAIAPDGSVALVSPQDLALYRPPRPALTSWLAQRQIRPQRTPLWPFPAEALLPEEAAPAEKKEEASPSGR